MFGKYPKEMEDVLGSLLPKFSLNEKEKLKKGLDFIGINYYTASYVQDCIYSKCDTGFGVSRTEGSYMKNGEKNGIPIGEPVRTLKLTNLQWLSPFSPRFFTNSESFNVLQTSFSWLNIYPEGMEKTFTYVKDRYNNTPMFITENGKQHLFIKAFQSHFIYVRFWI